MRSPTHLHPRLDGAALSVLAAAAVLFAGLVAAFILASGDSSQRVLMAAVAVVVLQVVLVLAIAAITLGSSRTRLYGIQSLAFAAALTFLAAAIVIGGPGSGVADALRSPLTIAAALMLVLFDTGRPSTWADRWVTLPAAAAAVLLYGAIFLLGPVTVTAWSGVFCLEGCPPTGLSASAAPGLQDALELAYAALRGVVFVGVAAGIVVRMRRARGVQRATLVPVAVVGVMVVTTGLMGVVVGLASPGAALPEWLQPGSFTRVLVPVGVAIALLLGQSARRRLKADLDSLRVVTSLPAAEQVVRRALSDPSARIHTADTPPESAVLQQTPLAAPVAGNIGYLLTSPGVTGSDPAGFADVVEATSVALSAMSVDRRIAELERALDRADAKSRGIADEARRQAEQAIHDTAQARIVLMRGHLNRLARDGSASASQVQDELALLAQQADAALADIRSAVMGMRPVAPGQLVPALREDARALPMPIAVDDHGIGALPTPCELAMHYGLREALQNAIKHAGSEVSVRVVLGRDPSGFAWAEVADDGCGFDPDATATRGLGDLRRRLDGLGGSLHVRSVPGAGTTVRMTVPTDTAQPARDAFSR